jgi:hypothetical protein
VAGPSGSKPFPTGVETLSAVQEHLADTLGMSIVHANKTLRRLHELKVIRWRKKLLQILDLKQLEGVAHWEPETPQMRPLI